MANHTRDESHEEEDLKWLDQSKGTARTVLESLIVITVLITCSTLIVLILSRKNLRRNMHMLLVGNLAMAGVMFGLLVRPGTIHEEIRSYELGYGYCVMYLFLLKTEWVVLPYSLWMLSIERCIAINEPQNYIKRFSTPAKVAMLCFPWILGVLAAIVINVALGGGIMTRYASYQYDPYFDEYTRFQQVACFVQYTADLFVVAHGLWMFFAVVIPFAGLIVTSIALLVTYCKKRRQKESSTEGELQVHAGSMVFCIVLNLAFVFVLTEEFIIMQREFLTTFLSTHWFVCIGELMIGVLGLSILSEVRQELARVCGCGGGGEEEQALLEVTRQESQTQDEK